MAEPIWVLIVEDSADDAELLLFHLRREGFAPDWRRVETAGEMHAALTDGSWDVILSDYTLPEFGALAALVVAREVAPDVPFIVVSGTVGEDLAVAAMRAGASDYVLKRSLTRLGPAVVRELREAGNRRERRRAEREVFRLAAIVQSTDDAIIGKTLDGVITDWNPGAERLYGYAAAEVVGRHISFLVPPDKANELAAILARLRRGERVEHFETVRLHKDGTRIDVSLTASQVRDGSGQVIGVSKIARDIRERKRAERRATVILESMREAFAILDTGWRFAYVNAAFERVIGLRREEVLGQNHWELFPATVGIPLEAEYRRVAATGGTAELEFNYEPWNRWFAVKAYPADGGGLCVMFRDVTQSRQAEEALRESEERFRTLVENASDALFVHAADGVIVDVNRRACESLGYAREELVGRPVTDIDPDVTADVLRRIRAELEAGRPVEFETRHRRRDGTTFPVEVRSSPFELGGRRLALALARDVTDRQRAQEAVRRSEERYRTLVAATTSIVWDTLAGGDFDTPQPGWTAFTGQPVEQHHGWGWLDAIHPDDRESTRRAWLAAAAARTTYHAEHRVRRADGEYRDMIARAVPILNGDGAVREWVGVHTDVTEQKRADDAIRESEARYRSLADAMPQIVWATRPDGYHEFYNRQWYDYTGLDYEQTKGEGWNHVFHPDDQPVAWERWRHSLATGDPYEIEYRCRRHDGEYRWFLGRALPQRAADGTIIRWFGTCTDIHDFKQAQAERAAALARLNLQVERMPLAYLLSGPDFRYTRWNRSAERIFGFTEAEVLGKHPFEVIVPAQSQPLVADVFSRLSQGDMDAQGTCENVTKDGQFITCEWHNTPLFGPDGAFQGILSLAQDVTARRQAEADLRLRDRAIQAVAGGLLITDPTQPDNPIIYASPGFERLTGYPRDEVVGRNCRFLQGPGTDPQVVAEVRQAVSEARPCDAELVNYRKDGTAFWNALAISPVQDEAGRLTHFIGVQSDVTARRMLERQFHQAQKMEAVGQLAGGVAHDFNNLLTIINGYGAIVHDALPQDHPSRELVAEITEAGERAAGLTRQLLAFSRQTVLEPKVLDPNAMVRDVERMLRRLIGEDIELATRLAPDLGRVKADPGQLEQAVVNLCVNARDAMPTGGKLTIETQNVELDATSVAAHPDVRPGPYVMVAVSDTGTGMTPEVQARIFEPFFTTKEQGKGTGLGLAMVFGFVKQSGGHIGVHSEVGRGATFKLYLPRVGVGPLAGKSVPHRTPMPKGTETVLLVEDEDAVRALGRHILTQCGYTVLVAGNGQEALRVMDGHAGRIHLLVTDVVMPGGMGGRQVAEAVTLRHPEVKVLFTSGYTDDAVVRHGVQHQGTHFLQKPFAPTTLARKVRDVLGKASEGGAP
jgi:PAS domain S-box-containing protein